MNLAKRDEEKAVAVRPSAVMFDGKDNYVYVLVDSITDEQLYQEICNDPRFKVDVERIENEKGSKETVKEEFLKKFKETRYSFTDPKTGEQQNDFANNKVNEKYLMVLRRNVTLGPGSSDFETIYSGIKAGDVVMMDGVNKARPFDLVKPVLREINDVAASNANASDKQGAERLKVDVTPASKSEQKGATNDVSSKKNKVARCFVDERRLGVHA